MLAVARRVAVLVGGSCQLLEAAQRLLGQLVLLGRGGQRLPRGEAPWSVGALLRTGVRVFALRPVRPLRGLCHLWRGSVRHDDDAARTLRVTTHGSAQERVRHPSVRR
ncbi:MAG TPA: hypothetical protein VI248_05915 [Kineosporiaceae bacterium]